MYILLNKMSFGFCMKAKNWDSSLLGFQFCSNQLFEEGSHCSVGSYRFSVAGCSEVFLSNSSLEDPKSVSYCSTCNEELTFLENLRLSLHISLCAQVLALLKLFQVIFVLFI